MQTGRWATDSPGDCDRPCLGASANGSVERAEERVGCFAGAPTSHSNTRDRKSYPLTRPDETSFLGIQSQHSDLGDPTSSGLPVKPEKSTN